MQGDKCVRSGRCCDGFPAYKRVLDVAIPIAPRPLSLAPASAPSIPLIAPNSTDISPQPLRQTTVGRGQRSAQPRKSGKSNNVAEKRQDTAAVAVYPSPPTTDAIAIVNSPTLYRPGGFSFSVQEGQYFEVFKTHTANELSGFFNSDFWTRSVLQESHSEASIRHAVVALGALYKTLEKASESPPGSPNSDTTPIKHFDFAMEQYSKSVTRLRESLENKETGSHRTILISIVLFTCLQSFTGDHKAAITQIQHGLGILEERRHDSREPLFRRRDDVVEPELIQIFTRLAIQAKSYDMAFHFPHPYIIRLTQPMRVDPTAPTSPVSPSDAASTSSMEFDIPAVFENSLEARQALDNLTERIMRFNELLSSYYHGPNNILPRSVLSSAGGFKMQLDQWDRAFQPLLEARRRPGVKNTERAGIDVLKMMHLMSSILFLMGFSRSEIEFDNFIPVFREIVKLAEEVVVDEELTLAQARCGENLASCRHRIPQPHNHFSGMVSHQPNPYREDENYTHIKASFALDLGIVPPLFVVATKCRDRKLRRQAINLLMLSPRREGMWDSKLSGRVAQWIMDVEETGMSPYSAASAMHIVPDESRVMVKEILFDMQKREATLRCGTRGAREGDRDARAQETHIWW